MRFVSTEKNYLGKDETLANADNLPWICAYLEIEPDGVTDGHGGEAVRFEGKVVGSTASVVFSPTVNKILAFAYIKPDAAIPGTQLEVTIAGQRVQLLFVQTLFMIRKACCPAQMRHERLWPKQNQRLVASNREQLKSAHENNRHQGI